jgi:hypothetical protein
MADSPQPVPREADRLIYAGLLGLAAAAVIQLSEKSDLDLPQIVEIYSFAVAIPLLAVGLITDYARREGTSIPPWRDLIGVTGSLASVVGLGALFFHFQVGTGAVFAAACVLGIILVRRL